MEPIKFEDNIREKLQEREITPSKGSWEKLESKINPSTSRKNYSPKWFAIAAGFAGVLMIASFIFNRDITSIKNDVKIVEAPINEIKLEDKNSTLVVAETGKDDENIIKESIVKEDKIIQYKNEDKIINKPLIATQPNNSSKEDITLIDKDSPNTSNNETNEESNIHLNKVDEVIAQAEGMEKNNQAITEEDIDALLSIAQREIQSQKIPTNKKVDATALLNVVESEMETTFRDKVFEALGEGYEKVRTAVIERKN